MSYFNFDESFNEHMRDAFREARRADRDARRRQYADWVHEEYPKEEVKEGVITIVSIPTKVKPEAYSNKSRRFRKDLKVGLGIDYTSIAISLKDRIAIQVDGEKVPIPSNIQFSLEEGKLGVKGIHSRLNRKYNKAEMVSLEKLLYLCIVESQYINFEMVK